MNLDNSADRLLGLIKRRGPQLSADLAALLGVTGEAVRQQLTGLEADGLVERTADRRGVGRPSHRWRLTSKGHGRFPDTHAELTLRLIEATRAAFGEAGLDKIIQLREAETEQTYRAALAPHTDLSTRVQALADIRSREGYMAEIEAAGPGFLLIEHHCPICAAATECQGFCRSELAVFRSVLGSGVSVERVEHVPEGARRCTYRIREQPDGVG
jgi:predicted ArsR family transcriptional regulator